MGLSCLTLPTSQEPRTEPSLDLIYRNSGTPGTPPRHWAGSWAGLGYLGWGQGLDPPGTLQRRLREGLVPHNKAQMTFAPVARAALGRGHGRPY